MLPTLGIGSGKSAAADAMRELGGQLINADLIKVAMLNIQRRLKTEGLEARMLLQIHDELVFETPAKDEKPLVRLVHDEMTQALAERLQVALRVDMSIGANWMDTSEAKPI